MMAEGNTVLTVNELESRAQASVEVISDTILQDWCGSLREAFGFESALLVVARALSAFYAFPQQFAFFGEAGTLQRLELAYNHSHPKLGRGVLYIGVRRQGLRACAYVEFSRHNATDVDDARLDITEVDTASPKVLTMYRSRPEGGQHPNPPIKTVEVDHGYKPAAMYMGHVLARLLEEHYGLQPVS